MEKGDIRKLVNFYRNHYSQMFKKKSKSRMISNVSYEDMPVDLYYLSFWKQGDEKINFYIVLN